MSAEVPMADDDRRKSVADLRADALAVDPGSVNANDLKNIIDIWKQVIAVQMHFNDICMTIRNIAITMLVSAVGFAAYTTKDNYQLVLFGWHVHLGALIALVGLVGWGAFWAMDRHWYHVFLIAAGVHAGEVEKRWHVVLPEMLLSSQIREYSGRVRFHSGQRLNAFYAIGGAVLLLTAILIALGHPYKP
jgi:hypothetical protein